MLYGGQSLLPLAGPREQQAQVMQRDSEVGFVMR